MSKLKVEDIQWSKHAYPLREAYKKCTFPAMFKVAQGYDSPDENESLARDQIVRVHQIHVQTRVLANVKKYTYLSIPLRYADARFEAVNSGKAAKSAKTSKKDKAPAEKSKPMYMRELIDKSLLPREVMFHADDDLTFQLHLRNNTVSEKFTTITLKNMYEVTYLQGNSIFHNHLDTMVQNLPLHAQVDVFVADGFRKSTPEKWNKYQTLLGKLVSKHVTFQLYPGNQNITYYSDKRLDKAKSQDDYELLAPSGSLIVTAGNERLKQRKVVAPGNGSRTIGPSSGNGAITANRRAAPSAPTPPSNNSNNSTFQGGVPNEKRQSLLDDMNSLDERKRISASGATMPRSILRQAAASENASEEDFPIGEDALSMHQRMMARTRDRRQSLSDIGLGGPPPVLASRTPQPMRKQSVPAGPMQLQSQLHATPQIDAGSSPAASPAPVARRSNVGVVPQTDTGTAVVAVAASASRRAPAPHPQNHQHPSSRGSVSSFSTVSDDVFPGGRVPPVDIPAPDYEGAPPLPDKMPTNTTHRSQLAHSSSMPTSAPPPPPLHTMPTRQSQPPSSVPPPPAAPPAPPPPPGAPPPPPAPGVPPPPGPPPPPGAPPPPPPGNAPAGGGGGLAASIAGAQLKPVTQRQESPRPLPPKEESPMTNMMRELRAIQERRKSSGDILALCNDDRMSIGSSGSGSEQTELEKAMARRKLGNFNAGPRVPPNPLPKTTPANRSPRTFNGPGSGNNSPRNNNAFSRSDIVNNNTCLQKLSDIPTDLHPLTVQQVSEILKLLNMEKYQASFKKHCIDGEMLLTLNREMLKGDLGLSELDINKILKFIKGWRPK